MKELHEKNYEMILNNHFTNNETIICSIVANPNCFSCLTNKKNISDLTVKYPENNLYFYYVDYVESDILQNYPEMNRITAYPKIIIFNGSWENNEILGGIIPLNKLENLFKKSQ